MTDGLSRVRAVMAAPEDIGLPEGMAPPEAPHPGDAAPPGDDPALMEALRDCAEEPLNDVGNGARMRRHFGADLVFVARVGWFVWDGKVWRADKDQMAVRRRAQKMGPLISQEVRFIEGSPMLSDADREKQKAERIGQRLRHAKNAGNSGPITNMMAESTTGLSREIDEMDAPPLMVNCLSGVLAFSVWSDPESGASKVARMDLLPHARDHLLTKMMPVEYEPLAGCPRFDAFLQRIQPNREIREFLARVFGLAMTALTGDQMLCFFYGNGANGKSVLIDLIARILGDYAATAKIESLTGTNRRGGGDATPDLVPLIGARFVRASEPDEGVKWQEGLIKDLTGGEPILVRALHSDFVSVRPQFKLIISGNHKPDIRGTDDGIWRRLKLVPFEETIPVGERTPKNELDAILFAEAPGVLNWMCRGLLDYLEGGLQEPDMVRLATAEFREESDPYGTFLEDACVVSGDPGDSLLARDMVQAFNFWRYQRGEGPFGETTIAKKIKHRSKTWRSRSTGMQFTEGKSVGISKYRGIRFNDIFGRAWDAAPKDVRGRAIGGGGDGLAEDGA
jgi:putative DNA primase/helicase